MQEAGATGKSIELISRNGVFPRVGEVNELVADQISQTGLKVNDQVAGGRPVADHPAAGQARGGPQPTSS